MARLVGRECAGILQQVEVRDRRDDEIGTQLPGAPLGRDLLIQLRCLQPNELDLDVRIALVEFADPELRPVEPGRAVEDETSLAPRFALEHRLALRRGQPVQRLPDARVVARRRLGSNHPTKHEDRYEGNEQEQPPRRRGHDRLRIRNPGQVLVGWVDHAISLKIKRST